MSELLNIKDLEVRFYTPEGVVQAVDGVNLSLNKGEILGIVGESGCGKSVTARSVMRLIPNPPGKIVKGSITLDGKDVLSLNDGELLKFRGNDAAMIFQEPMTSLNPVFTVKDQLLEAIMLHQEVTKQEALERAVKLLEMTGIPSAADRINSYPHQLSGGMRQRVMIAMAISCNPKLLIADEPTTALDVTIQAQILEIMRNLRDELDMGIMLITHDLGVVAEMADRVAVMYAGRVVEVRNVKDLYDEPLHPYTLGLLGSIPGVEESSSRLSVIEGSVPNLLDLPKGCTFCDRCRFRTDVCSQRKPELQEIRPGSYVACFNPRLREEENISPGNPQRIAPLEKNPGEWDILVNVRELKKDFTISGGMFRKSKGTVHAVSGLNFSIRKGEVFSLVGESGCGKTTTGRMLAGLEEPTGGGFSILGRSFAGASSFQLKELRKKVQIIFQDPYSSLNPRMKVGTIIGEGLRIHRPDLTKSEKTELINRVVKSVGLEPYHLSRYPHEFSGGQRQRIGIARALILEPEFIICDEPVSALDVSIQAQILNLMKDLQEEFKLTYLFIAHDLFVVKHLSDRVGILYLGQMMELADKDDLYANPVHPYTKALLSAAPKPVPGGHSDRIILEGDLPSPINPPSGCKFRTRCPLATERCASEEPAWREIGPGHFAACHYV